MIPLTTGISGFGFEKLGREIILGRNHKTMNINDISVSRECVGVKLGMTSTDNRIDPQNYYIVVSVVVSILITIFLSFLIMFI